VTKAAIIELHHCPSFVYRQVVLHHNGGFIAALELEVLHEVQEGLGVIAALKDLVVHKPSLGAQGTYQRD